MENKIKSYSTNEKLLEKVYLFFSRQFNFLSLIVFLLSFPLSAHSAVFNVSSGDVAGLIDAIFDATSNDDPDTIILESGTYTLTREWLPGG